MSTPASSASDRFALLEQLPALRALLEPDGFRVVDVGGRGSALPAIAPFAPLAHYYSFEPDADEADRLRTSLPAETAWRSVTVVPAALAETEGTAHLHLTERAGMSSLLDPNPEVAGRFYESRAFAVRATVEVPTLGLDAAAARYGFTDAALLKLDTQGTELAVLRSGPRTLASAGGVYVESLFQPFYRNQALFADVDAHLRAAGFTLFGLSRTLRRRANHRRDLYSRRPIVWAHCLYLREPASISERGGLLRLLVLALAFKYFDLALEMVELGQFRAAFPEAWTALARETEAFIREQTRRLVKDAHQASARPSADPEAVTAGLLATWNKDDRTRD
jgi:FkbM family methyltransferase